MVKPTSYYKDLAGDYSKPGLVPAQLGEKLIDDYEQYITLKEATFPEINSKYNLEQIEKENKEWWSARCEAMREGRGELLNSENARDFVYLCQDGLFKGSQDGAEIIANWSAILSQSGATMVWPIVMFHGEAIYFEWTCLDDKTSEIIAQGNVTYLRRGHRGGCYLKTEKLAFYRNVSASNQLMKMKS